MKAKKLTFAVEDIQVIRDDVDRSQFSLLKVDAFATGKSAHHTFVTEETLKRTAKSILQKPFVFELGNFNDLGTHSNKEIAGGFVPHNSPMEFKTLPDGRIMLSVEVLIWKRYSGKLLEYFERDGNRKGVSVEIEVFEVREDESTGLLELLDFCYTAITALGDMITPAIPDAEAVLQFAKAREEYEFSSRYAELDFSIPASVKKTVKKAFDIYKEKGGAKSTAVAMARHLSNATVTTPERLKQMSKYFSRKEDTTSINHSLWGGNAGKTWCKEMCNAMGEIDEKQTSFFAIREQSDVISDMDTYEDTINIESKEDITQMAKKINMAEPEVDEKAEKEEMAIDTSKEEMAVEEKPVAEEMASPVDEGKKEEEKSESKEEEKKEVEMAEEPQEKEEGSEKPFSMDALMAKVKELEDENKVYLAENEELKAKFAEIEKEKKEFAVDAFLAELNSKVVVSPEAHAKMKEKASSFSFATLDGWKNECKAIAFEFAKRSDEKDDNSISIFALPYQTNVKTQTQSVWDNLK